MLSAPRWYHTTLTESCLAGEGWGFATTTTPSLSSRAALLWSPATDSETEEEGGPRVD
jgi:hypothetical protein